MKNLRYYIFWTLDFFKGSPVKKHIKEIKAVFYSEPFSQSVQQKRLSDILDYAINNTLFYQNSNPKNLKSFPVVTKQDIVENMDAMFSEEFYQKKDSLRIMATSGSTGTPLKMFQNGDKVRRSHADLLFFYEIGGYQIGDRLYSLRVWNELNRKSRSALIKENFKMFDTSTVDAEGAKTFVDTMLKDTSTKVILAYASSFNSLMQHIKPGTIKWNIKSIFTGSELLLPETKKKMLDTFGCPVMSRYRNQENGMLAQQPVSGEDYFQLNEASYHFEFLKLDTDEEASEGEAARIVITDLFNRAIPMIRYDTGDIGEYAFASTGKRILTKLVGRKIDFLKTSSGKVLSPHVVTNLMWEFDYISQFQFIQETLTTFTLKIAYLDASNHASNVETLNKRLKNIFGDNITVEIIKIDNIPLELSGKRKYIISRVI